MIRKDECDMILIVSSKKDVASLNIAKQILENYSFEEKASFQGNPAYETISGNRKVRLITLNEESVKAQSLTNSFDELDLMVFISRHSSESGTPTLSVHTPGNFGKAELGGLPRRVSISPANAMRNALRMMARLRSEMQLSYDVSYECTHHGPSLDVPTMFVELGSSAAQWNDPVGAEAVAQAAMEAVSAFGVSQAKAVLGIGGPHYNSKFTRIALENDLAFGHIIPKYAIEGINIEIIRHCVDRTLEKVDNAILDWKGIRGENKVSLVKMLTEIGLPFEKV
jgi:D-aminoacyl-tRNA deacylase